MTQQTDAELVAFARRGDRSAFAAIYDRYADKLFEFSRSVLRDSEVAADVTQDTFVLAAERLEQLREPSKLRAWLYAIARNEATRHGRARSRTAPTDEVAEVASDRAGPEELSARDDLATLVWDAAAGLSERDRILLELTVRQGLDGQELADAIGTTPANAYSMASRLRDQVERSLGALLVARHARQDCDELQVLLAGWDGSFSPLVRKRVARHVERCEICGERRRSLASPLALLATIPVVPAPAELREQVLGRIDLISHSSPVGRHGRRRGRWQPDGFPPAMVADDRRRRAPVFVAAAALLVVLALVLRPQEDTPTTELVTGASTSEEATTSTTVAPGELSGGEPGPGDELIVPEVEAPAVAAAPGVTSSPASTGPAGPATATATAATKPPSTGPTVTNPPTTGTTPTTPPPTTAPPTTGPTTTVPTPTTTTAVPVVTTTAPAVTTTTTSPPTTTSSTTPSTTTTTRPTTTTTINRGPVVASASAGVARLSVRGCGISTTTVRADVTDDSGVSAVELVVSSPDGTTRTAMTRAGSVWTGNLGPFSKPGMANWQVIATDTLGASTSSARSTPIDACPIPG